MIPGPAVQSLGLPGLPLRGPPHVGRLAGRGGRFRLAGSVLRLCFPHGPALVPKLLSRGPRSRGESLRGLPALPLMPVPVRVPCGCPSWTPGMWYCWWVNVSRLPRAQVTLGPLQAGLAPPRPPGLGPEAGEPRWKEHSVQLQSPSWPVPAADML